MIGFNSGQRITFNNEIIPVVAQSVALGRFPLGKQIALIVALDNAGNIVSGSSLSALVLSVTGGTVYERGAITGALDGSGFGQILAVANISQGFTSADLVINFIPAPILTEINILWV